MPLLGNVWLKVLPVVSVPESKLLPRGLLKDHEKGRRQKAQGRSVEAAWNMANYFCLRNRFDAQRSDSSDCGFDFSFVPRIAVGIAKRHRKINHKTDIGGVGAFLDCPQRRKIFFRRLVLVPTQKCG